MGELEERILLMDRIRMLEKATAVAYLDANLSGERYAHEAEKVTQAEQENKHYRLIVVPTPSGGVHATIEVVG